MRFVVTDTDNEITVNYKGILPDLFKEGKGVVAQGKMTDARVFGATEVSAAEGAGADIDTDDPALTEWYEAATGQMKVAGGR